MVEAAAKWYCDNLGFEVMSDDRRPADYCEAVTGISGAELHIIYVRGGGYAIELIQYTGAPGVKIDTATNNVGSAHVCFNVDDFDVMLKRALAGGATLAGERTIIPEGNNAGKAVVYFEDPDGNTIEFISNEVLAAAS